jgi:hypothetical protein
MKKKVGPIVTSANSFCCVQGPVRLSFAGYHRCTNTKKVSILADYTIWADLANSYRRVATYVDKIIKDAKPADLPVEQPTKFDLVINLKTAKQMKNALDNPQ